MKKQIKKRKKCYIHNIFTKNLNSRLLKVVIDNKKKKNLVVGSTRKQEAT